MIYKLSQMNIDLIQMKNVLKHVSIYFNSSVFEISYDSMISFLFSDKVREVNGCCLVHCLAGISRSPTLAIAYIMKHLNMTSDGAYRYKKQMADFKHRLKR